MEKHKNIYQKINEVMKEVSYIQKGPRRVNGQYTYISHDQVTAALHDPLTKNGIAVIPTVADLKQEGNTTIAKVIMDFVNIDDPADRVSTCHYGYGIDNQDKGPGKAISYACKYALLKTFGLETGDDPDHDQDVVKEAVHKDMKKPATVMNDDEVSKFFEKHAQEKGVLVDYVMKVSKMKNISTNHVVTEICNDYDNKMALYNSWKNGQKG